MKFARVIGTVVATRKYQDLEGIKFLVVQPLTKKLEPVGEPVVAADGTAQAGPGNLVFIVGIVDEVESVDVSWSEGDPLP